MSRFVDIGSSAVIFITFVLFVIALFVKGLTHDLLLEAAVFLISVKLILMSHKNSMYIEFVGEELKEIKRSIQKN